MSVDRIKNIPGPFRFHVKKITNRLLSVGGGVLPSSTMIGTGESEGGGREGRRLEGEDGRPRPRLEELLIDYKKKPRGSHKTAQKIPADLAIDGLPFQINTKNGNNKGFVSVYRKFKRN